MKERLTNEKILKRFKGDGFALVNYAIELGKESIEQGREFHTKAPIQNQAFQILLEIDLGKDKLPPPAKKEVAPEEKFVSIVEGQ